MMGIVGAAAEVAKGVLMSRNFPTLLTFLSAIIAFSLSLVALLSSGEKGALNEYAMLSFNASTVGQNAIKVENTTTTSKRDLGPMITPAPSAGLYDSELVARQLSLPGVSQITSFFGSVGGDLVPTATGAAGAQQTGTGNILSDLETFITGFVEGGITVLGQDIVKLTNTLVGDVTTELGIQEGYYFYMTQYCSGNYVPNYSDPNAKMNFTSCTPYSNISIGSSEPSNSTIVVGTTKLDFSAINIPNKFSGGGGALHAVLGAIEAFQIIGIVTAGILIILCPLHLVISAFSFWVRLLIAALTAISFITIAIDALLLTGVSVVASVLVNKLVGDLGLTGDPRVGFLAMVLISTVFMGMSTMVWLVQAFNNRYEVKGVQKDEISRPILQNATTMSAYPERPAKSYNEASRFAEEPGYQTGTISRVI